MNTNKCLATQRDKPSTPILVDCNPDSVYQQWTMASKFKWQAGGDEPPNDSEDMWTTVNVSPSVVKTVIKIESNDPQHRRTLTKNKNTRVDSTRLVIALWQICFKKRKIPTFRTRHTLLIHLYPCSTPKILPLSLSTTYFLCMLMPSKLWSVPHSGVKKHLPD